MADLLDRIHDLYDELERHRVMLSFKGILTPELITALLVIVERKLMVLEAEPKARKRVFNVVVECLQNLYHHNGGNRTDGEEPMNAKDRNGVVMIARSETGYSVLTGNFMADQEVGKLKNHLDRINALDAEALRQWYRAKLADGTYSEAGGGGLGMIDIARRSGGKLEYAFVPYDKDSSFFSLNVNVNT